MPVIVGDRVVGTLDVEDERTDAFSDDDRLLFERVTAEMRPQTDVRGGTSIAPPRKRAGAGRVAPPE